MAPNFIKKDFDSSQKDIPIPPKDSYLKILIDKTCSFLTRIRWRATIFLNNRENGESDSEESESEESGKMTYGFPTSKTPPAVKELAAFERDIWDLVENIEFTDYVDPYQKHLKKEMRDIKRSKDVMLCADKTRNIYKTKPEVYNKLLTENITQNYKKIEDEIVDNINREAKEITKKLDIEDRVEQLTKKEAVIFIKDHKQNFQNTPSCRLINPTKSNIGVISQINLQKINETIRNKTKLKQWRNTNEVLTWFRNLDNKQNLEFLQCDIKDFYPSITEKTLEKAISFGSKYTLITEKEKEIIRNARKTVLYSNNQTWSKKKDLFDVSMGAYDGAEVAELVGLLLLHNISEQLPQLNFGLYRDDGLGVYKTTSGQNIDHTRKKLETIFKDLDLKITFIARQHSVNFLDTTLDLQTNSYKPYIKPNDKPVYIHTQSNHPPHIKKQLPHMIEKRLSTLSSSEQIFKEAIPTYEQALKKSGYKQRLTYIKQQDSASNTNNKPKRKRKRNKTITWYNPPFNKAVKTKLGKKFLEIVDKHFKDKRKDGLHKILNRHTLKLSYSCTQNVKAIITSHNRKVLDEHNKHPQTENKKMCNCQKKIECPIEGACLQKSVVYKAQVNAPGTSEKTYFGSTERTFKKRFYEHTSDIKNQKYRNNTSLSTYVWELKEQGKTPKIKWSIVKTCNNYIAGQRKCDLCLHEKLVILKNSKNVDCLNVRSELMSKCKHKYKWLLINVKDNEM